MEMPISNIPKAGDAEEIVNQQTGGQPVQPASPQEPVVNIPNEIENLNDYNPLDLTHGMVDRAYANQLGNAQSSEIIDRVPEPAIEMPPPPPATPTVAAAEEPVNPYQDPLNPGLAFMPKSDITDAAKNTANMLLGGYKQGWGMVPKLITVSQTELQQLVVADKISPSLEVEVGKTPISVGAIFNDIETQAITAFEVSDDFINDIRPPLERELSRRGAGMSDMQYIMQAVARDSVPRIAAIFSIRNSTQQILEGIQKIHADMKVERDRVLNSSRAMEAENIRLREENARIKFQQSQQSQGAAATTPNPTFDKSSWEAKHKK